MLFCCHLVILSLPVWILRDHYIVELRITLRPALIVERQASPSLPKMDSLIIFEYNGELKRFYTMYSTALYTTYNRNFGWKSAKMPSQAKKCKWLYEAIPKILSGGLCALLLEYLLTASWSYNYYCSEDYIYCASLCPCILLTLL